MRLVGRRGRLVRRVVYALVTVLSVLGTLEVGARVLGGEALGLGDAPAPADGAPTLRGNPYLLWEYAPGERFELGRPVRINSLGLRGAEPASGERLMVTGDSSVYGYGVDDDEVYVVRAARELGMSPINAAIPGYSSFQTRNLLELRGWALEPSVVVIGNLWSDNNFDSFVDRELLSAYDDWERSGVGVARRMLSWSALYRVLDARLRVLTGSEAEARKVGWTVGGGTPSGHRRVALADYAANLQHLAERARDEGADVVFLVLPHPDDLTPREGPAAWTPYRDVMRGVAARVGAPLVDGPALVAASGLGREALFLDEMHPTAAGHALLADALVEVLRGDLRPAPSEVALELVDPFAGRGPRR